MWVFVLFSLQDGQASGVDEPGRRKGSRSNHSKDRTPRKAAGLGAFGIPLVFFAYSSVLAFAYIQCL